MPTEQMTARGGVTRWRTVTLKNGKVIRVAIVRKKGPRGGHTIAGTENR